MARDWSLHFGLEGKHEIWRVILVSLFAMAAIRSSVANIRIGDKDVPAGIFGFLDSFLKDASNEIERSIIKRRWEALIPHATGMAYGTAKPYLMAVAVGSIASLSEKDREEFTAHSERIDALQVSNSVKMHLFATLMVGILGHDLFVSFAKSMDIALADESNTETAAAQDRRQRLKDAKKLLS